MRSYGDQFYKKHCAARAKVARETVQQAAEDHKKQYHRGYLAFLASEEQRLQNDDAAGYAAFMEHRLEERTFIENSRFYTPEQRDEQLKRFDRTSRRLIAFQEFYQKIPAFWEWDRTYNETPFDKSKVTV